MKIYIIDYGVGNIQSIQFAFKRIGYDAVLTHSIKEIKNADKVIFPGVGHANSAMERLQQTELISLIPQLTQPVLGICVGMQLMCKHTEEGDIKGLGIFDVAIKKFDHQLKVPQVGWNTISELKSPLFESISENSYMYLVHSYYAPICQQTISQTNYGVNYSTALHQNNFYAVQFHPEKSSATGTQLLSNFMKL